MCGLILQESAETLCGVEEIDGEHTVAVWVLDEHDFRKDREPKSKPRTGQGSEGTFTRVRHGTLKGDLQSKKIHETAIDGVRRF